MLRTEFCISNGLAVADSLRRNTLPFGEEVGDIMEAGPIGKDAVHM